MALALHRARRGAPLCAALVASLFLTVTAPGQTPSARQKPSEGGIAGTCVPICDGDVDQNGVIDVNDLVDVILNWGPCGTAPCPQDFDGDGDVDVDDLVSVILNWGVCSAPSNDVCQQAIWLDPYALAPFEYCTTGANTDGPATDTCLFFGDDQVNQDIWYKMESPWDGVLRVNTCGSSYDTKIAIYREQPVVGQTCPGGLFSAIIVGCNDDSCGLQSELEIDVQAGTTYTIRVGGFGSAEGAGILDVSFPITGNECEDCIPIASFCSFSCFESRTGNTESYDGVDESGCAFNDSKDAWYCYTVACNTIPLFTEFSTCNPGTDFDTVLTIYQGTCNGLVEIGCNDDTVASECQLPNGLNRKSRVLLENLSEFTTYYVRVSGFNDAVGNYELTIDTQCIPGNP